MQKKLKQAFGNWVVGDQFWGREKDIELFIDRIDEGANQLLVAQRRMGKTSLMRETARQLGDRYTCLFIDLQKASEPAEAIVELSLAMHAHKPLWDKTKDVFANALKHITGAVEKIGISEVGITLRAGLTGGNWTAKGDELFDILASAEKPVLLQMDEVPIMVNRMLKGDEYKITPERRAKADAFMSWLRKNSIEHQGKVRIVMSGSIGFGSVLHQANLTATINNFAPFELRPWDEETAIGCLFALANEYGVRFDKDTPAEIVRRLGCCIPHHVQMFFTYILDRCRRTGNMEFPRESADEIYNTEMLGIRGHAELTHYEERLKLVIGPTLYPVALDLLTHAAIAEKLTQEDFAGFRAYYTSSDKSLVGEMEGILRLLEHDGYLRPSPEGYVFVSNVLRDWWKRAHNFSYIPVRERSV